MGKARTKSVDTKVYRQMLHIDQDKLTSSSTLSLPVPKWMQLTLLLYIYIQRGEDDESRQSLIVILPGHKQISEGHMGTRNCTPSHKHLHLVTQWLASCNNR